MAYDTVTSILTGQKPRRAVKKRPKKGRYNQMHRQGVPTARLVRRRIKKGAHLRTPAEDDLSARLARKLVRAGYTYEDDYWTKKRRKKR